jgi:predicted metal-dependent hydrolase
MRSTNTSTIQLADRKVEYRVKPSRTARKLRIRVGLHGVQVLRPTARPDEDITRFLERNQDWILRALDRAEQLRGLVKPARGTQAAILFRGERIPVRVIESPGRKGNNRISLDAGAITITRPAAPRTDTTRSLQNWLRKQARAAINAHLKSVLQRINRKPGKVYIMAQRTKWGNCSAMTNLSFNWRLIMAPDFVLRYLVTHEAVHLAIPDHSQKFWLTVQSLCPETERARQWLVANAQSLLAPLPS